MITVALRLGLGPGCGLLYTIQTAGESEKMRISRAIKTDQWRSDLQIYSTPHFVVSPHQLAFMHANRDIVIANPSICPMAELCLNEWAYRHIF